MKTFQIQYISRYYTQKEHHEEIITAKTEESALKKFAKSFGIKSHQDLFDTTFIWENGEWLSSFKCVTEVKEMTCTCCNGTGKIQINQTK